MNGTYNGTHIIYQVAVSASVSSVLCLCSYRRVLGSDETSF